jgi:hypothetical protein
MEKVTLCVCGCGEEAVFAAHHCHVKPRSRITADDYEVVDLGYVTPCFIVRTRLRAPITTYAMVTVGGRTNRAHRLMYEQEVGPIPAGMVIDHLCRNHRCIRPSHLEPVTRGENTRRGILSKLTWEAVDEIRSTEGVVRAKDLAHKYGVSQTQIHKVRRHEIWKDKDRF